MPRQLKPCGTEAAYQRHRRRGEEPCEPCKQAAREVRYPRSGIYQRARIRALGQLGREYRARYLELLDEELAYEYRNRRPAVGRGGPKGQS